MKIFIYVQLELNIARGWSAITFAFEKWKVKSLRFLQSHNMPFESELASGVDKF